MILIHPYPSLADAVNAVDPPPQAKPSDFFEEFNLGKSDAPAPEAEAGAARWSTRGFVKQQIVYAPRAPDDAFPFSRDRAGLTQFRSTLNVSLQGRVLDTGSYRVSGNGFYDLYYRYGAKDDVSDAEYDDQVSEAEWREVFVNIEPARNLWLKFGRQIVAWGESDFTQILDVVNPRDEREFGLVDLEDARLPVWATRLSFVGDRWGSDLVLTHEFEPNRLGAEGSDYDPFIRFRPALDIAGPDDPVLEFERPDYVLRGFASFAKGDVGLIYGKVRTHSPVFSQSQPGTNAVERDYPRVETVGLTANFVAGFWLLKTEVAHKEGTRFARADFGAQMAAGGPLSVKKPLDQWMAGIEYSGFDEVQMSLEWVGSRIDDYDDSVAQDRTDAFFSSRVSYDFWHDTANLEAVWAHWMQPRGDSVRLVFTYNVSDTVKVAVGGIDYAADDSDALLYPYRNNDRIFSSVRYSF